MLTPEEVAVLGTVRRNANWNETFDEQVYLCKMWLRRYATPAKRINYRRNTYGLKHTVERWIDETGLLGFHHYIGEDAFIQAAERLGYVIEYGRIRANLRVKTTYRMGEF